MATLSCPHIVSSGEWAPRCEFDPEPTKGNPIPRRNTQGNAMKGARWNLPYDWCRSQRFSARIAWKSGLYLQIVDHAFHTADLARYFFGFRFFLRRIHGAFERGHAIVNFDRDCLHTRCVLPRQLSFDDRGQFGVFKFWPRSFLPNRFAATD